MFFFLISVLMGLYTVLSCTRDDSGRVESFLGNQLAGLFTVNSFTVVDQNNQGREGRLCGHYRRESRSEDWTRLLWTPKRAPEMVSSPRGKRLQGLGSFLMLSYSSIHSQPCGFSHQNVHGWSPLEYILEPVGAYPSPTACYSNIIMHKLYRFILGVVTRSSEKVNADAGSK